MGRRRVLIVTSTYCPAMLADMHRARHLAWTLPEFGWDVEVLTAGVAFQPPYSLDTDSAEYFPSDAPVHSVNSALAGLWRRLGFRSIGWRAIWPMFAEGARLLRTRRFDLVYFSTTQFPLFLLGPVWRRMFKVSYVLDFHDPCFRPGNRRSAWMRQSWKHLVSSWLTKFIEKTSIRSAAAIVSVSPHYLAALRERYVALKPAWIQDRRSVVIPFSSLDRDAATATAALCHRPQVALDECFKVVYVGAGGPIMERAFSLFGRALARVREDHPGLLDEIKFNFYGTHMGWQPGDRKVFETLAGNAGVGELIDEQPMRVSYRRSMELMQQSDGLLIFGVDDAGYMPSKLCGYAMSGKPLLACTRGDGIAAEWFRSMPELGHLIWFDRSREMDMGEAATCMQSFLEEVATHRRFDRSRMLEPYLAPAMARRHAELFEACLHAGGDIGGMPLGPPTPSETHSAASDIALT